MGAGDSVVERPRPRPASGQEDEKPHPLRDALKAALKDAPVKTIDNKTEKHETIEKHTETKAAPAPNRQHASHAHAAGSAHTHETAKSHEPTSAEKHTEHDRPVATPEGKTHEEISEEIIRKILYGTDEKK